MRIALVLIVLLVFSAVAHADLFTWSEDFQAEELSDYWQLQSDDDSYVGIVEDPEDPANKVLMIDTWDSGGLAYAEVVNDFNGIDGTQEITASFRFYLADSDNSWFTILGTVFTGVVDFDAWYSPNDGLEDPFEIPVGEWVDFRYVFTPDEEVGVTTHTVYLNDVLMGEFDNIPSPLNEGAVFFMGDDEEDGYTYGVAYWDDFQITGTADVDSDVPEPGSLLTLLGGITGVGSMIFARRRRGN